MNDARLIETAEAACAAAATVETFDVLIVGAGISGIDAAWHLQSRRPSDRWQILEARETIGGTWDLFRYPGVRSDSDMFTLGFPFRPWTGDRAIVDGPSIRAYVEETARMFGIERNIRFGHRVVSGSWSSAEARWTLEVEAGGSVRHLVCRFLFLCSGYYDYQQGHRPTWPEESRFDGRIVHPQHWPKDLDTAGSRIVVIGSGATAVTLVPALARTAAHVTMLQRSPTYIVSRPSRDAVARGLQRWLPARAAAALVRWKNILLGQYFFSRARSTPDKVRRAILKLAARDLPDGYEVERHFSPAYDPWDQRLCLVPDGDLFDAIRRDRVEIVTDRIACFTESGIALESGRELLADIVVTATGLKVKLVGGIALEVDGLPVDLSDRLIYRGMMLSGVPNLAFSFGYINASWTLKCDLTSRHVCRLLDHMERRGARFCVPRLPDGPVERRPMLDFTSGYVRRAEPILPGQGARHPWRVHQNYLRDLAALRFAPVEGEGLDFRGG